MEDIKGYVKQEPETIALINEAKEVEENVLKLLDWLEKSGSVDPRWFAIGRTHLEQGFMAVVRSIAKPQRLRK